MANLTLFDLAVVNRADQYTGLIEDVTTLPREFATLPATPRTGTYYEVVKRIALPVAQFRRVNAGVTPSKSTYKREWKEMFPVDLVMTLDEAVDKGDDGSIGGLMQAEAKGAMESGAILLGQQVYYGVSADANGFAGVRTQLAFTQACGATTNSTSAYLLWPDKQGVTFDVGKNGEFAIKPWARQLVADSTDSTKFFNAWVTNMQAWVGFQCKSNLSAFACTGIKTDNIANYLTDDDGSALLARIPAARRNGLVWYMNRTAIETLRRSRSTINLGLGIAAASYQSAGAAGTPAFAPTATNLVGYPIETTDSIVDTETNS